MSGYWRRLGLIGSAAGAAPWAVSHSALPALSPRSDGQWDLYLSTRDKEGRARIARGRFRVEPTPTIEDVQTTPVLDLGALGTFDDRGVTMSSIVSAQGRRYLYYTGWMLGVTVPFYLAAGLAVSDDGGATFRRLSQAPLLDRNEVDPFLTASPFVMIDNGVWRMWYVSGSAWTLVNGTPRHSYHIKYAESQDGVHWTRSRPRLPRLRIRGGVRVRETLRTPRRRALSDVVRGQRAEISHRLRRVGRWTPWTRLDQERGLDASGSGWDSEMVEYPWLFEQNGREYMLYNGDDYGRSGVGLAVWESAD